MKLFRVRYGNYEPAEVDSVHATEADAHLRVCTLRGEGGNMWEVDEVDSVSDLDALRAMLERAQIPHEIAADSSRPPGQLLWLQSQPFMFVFLRFSGKGELYALGVDEVPLP